MLVPQSDLGVFVSTSVHDFLDRGTLSRVLGQSRMPQVVKNETIESVYLISRPIEIGPERVVMQVFRPIYRMWDD